MSEPGLRLTQGPVHARVSNVHHVDERGAWGSRGRRIYFRSPEDDDWRLQAVLPPDLPRDLFAPSRLASRVLRLERCNLYATRAGRLLAIRGGQVYRVESDRCIPLFRIRGDCVMNRAIAEDASGALYFGEYFMNPARVPVRVWRLSPDLDQWEVACELESPRLRHVHAVHLDPWVEGRLWVTGGDFQGECYLGYSDDGCRSLQWIGDGGQQWRTVGLIFQEERICWMTDSHLEQNYVVSMDRSTHRATLHAERDASSWYQAETSDGLYLATSCVEPGPGIQTRHCRLMASRDALHWTTLARYEKDPLPFRFFGFGFLSLPSGRFSSRDFWLSGGGVRGLGEASRRCEIGTTGAPA